MKKRIPFAVCLGGLTMIVSAALTTGAATAAAGQRLGWGPGLPPEPPCNFWLQTTSCTGCVYGPAIDANCNSGMDWESCTISTYQCTEGSSYCYSAVSSGPCDD